jgi:hypothetical protein
MPDSYGKRQRREVKAKKRQARDDRRVARNERRDDRAADGQPAFEPLGEPLDGPAVPDFDLDEVLPDGLRDRPDGGDATP